MWNVVENGGVKCGGERWCGMLHSKRFFFNES